MSFIIFIHILYIHTHSTYMYIHSYIVFYIHTCMHVHVGNLNSKVKHFLTELKNLLHINSCRFDNILLFNTSKK